MLKYGDKITCIKEWPFLLTVGEEYVFSNYHINTTSNSNQLKYSVVVLKTDNDDPHYLESHVFDFDYFGLDADIKNHQPTTKNTLSLATLKINGQIVTPINNVTYAVNTDKLECQHKWKKYHGLFEQYEYCEECNEKK